MDEDVDVGAEMVKELGIDPAAGVDSNQRFELLRKWHREDAEKAKQNEDDA